MDNSESASRPCFSRSSYGDRLRHDCGILELMNDLGEALTVNHDAIMMGGGNPARIAGVEAILYEQAQRVMDSAESFGAVLANYDPPAGNPLFREAVAGYLRRRYGWQITAENVGITNGGQTAFFFLLNMLGGPDALGRNRYILLPRLPEYIGYADQGFHPDLFVGIPGKIQKTGPHRFRYELDFPAIEAAVGGAAALCVSRPSNPSSHVLTDEEVEQLTCLARQHGIPLLIDHAYGNPFPGVVYTATQPQWTPDIVLTLSLSKLGLPSTRTGIVIAEAGIIRDLASLTAIVGLSNGAVGQALVRELLLTGEMDGLCENHIRPFYRQRLADVMQVLDEALAGLPHEVHEPEGAFFLWLRFPGLPISTKQLYQRLKERGVLVVPGEYFYYGCEMGDRRHQECIRISYTQPLERLRAGFQIMAEVLADCFTGSPKS